MKILHGYQEPKPAPRPPELLFGVMEGKDNFWRHVGPAHKSSDAALQYADSRDMGMSGFTQRITRIWRIYG